MSEELFGSGILLDETLDFTIDPTGDLSFESGTDELEKDLSLQMIFSLSEYTGKPPSGNVEEQVLHDARIIALADSRISSVDRERSTVTYGRDRDELQVQLLVRASGEEQELVFNL